MCACVLTATTAPFAAITHSPQLNHEGLDEIRFGETLSSMSLTFTYQGAVIEGCQYVELDKYPDISVMVVDGVIERIDTENIELIADSSPFFGLATGTMTLQTFQQNHPKIEVVQHEYENGFYLRWYNKQQDKGIVVDYVDGNITAIKAGLVPSVLFVEGCA